LEELAFATIINKAQAMMASANIPVEVRYKLWKEAIQTATDLDGLILRTMEGITKTWYEHAYGSNPKFATHLWTWEEAGTVKTKSTGTPKLHDQGAVCIFIGYARDHEGDCYRMWNPLTNGVSTTRDIIWLRRMYYSKDNVVVEPMVLDDDLVEDIQLVQYATVAGLSPGGKDGDEVSIGNETAPVDNLQPLDDTDSDDDDVEAPEVRTKSGRTIRAPSRLISEIGTMATSNYEIALSQPEYNFYSVMTQLNEDVGELACMATVNGMEYAMMDAEYAFIGAALGGGFDNTTELYVMNYKEAMESDDKEKWLAAMKEEHERMVKKKVWKAIPPSEVPKGEKISC
jgi:hypothetical protein